MENLIYIIVSYLYIAILLLFRTKKGLSKSTPWKVVFYGLNRHFNKKRNAEKWEISDI